MKQIFFFLLFGVILIAVLAFLFQKHGTFDKKQPKTVTQSVFVTRNGKELFVNGKQYRSIGVNRYNLLTYRDANALHGVVGCASPFEEQDLDSMFKLFHDSGITTVRFWLFQSFTKSGSDTARFDYVLDLASKYNIKLIPVLENHWKDCTEAGDKTVAWYQSGYQSPYGAYSLSLPAYIQAIVPKYKDNPNILTWEIMNEAQSTDEQALYNFAQTLSAEVKQLDPNHLVSIGLTGTKESDSFFSKVSLISSVDSIDYHDYEKNDEALPTDLQKRFANTEESYKPIFIGESGIKDEVSNRADLLANKISAYFNQGGSIYLIWSYGEGAITNDGFNFGANDPVMQMVRQKASEL